MTKYTPEVEKACKDFAHYMRWIVEPAISGFTSRLKDGPLHLHEVYGINLFVAHAVDYILAIREADKGSNQSRTKLVRAFDRLYSVQGARLSNRKFELIDAINNSLKHIQLDADRYDHLTKRYGPMSFRNLTEEDGRVLCILKGYRFDYARVVLRPAFSAISGINLESVADVLEFSRGGLELIACNPEDELMASDDPADAIDQMIMHCNPTCDDCGEGEENCYCAEFVYAGNSGEFTAIRSYNFDFDTVMSRISGAYRPND